MTTNEIEVVARRLMERIHVEEFCTRRSIGKRHHVVGLADYDVFCEGEGLSEDFRPRGSRAERGEQEAGGR